MGHYPPPAGATLSPLPEEWFEPSVHPPELVPVIAEFWAYNHDLGELSHQTVCHFEGGWRTYPVTEGNTGAYVNRWGHIPGMTIKEKTNA